MKKFSKLVIVFLSISVFLVSCKESTDKKQKTNTTVENKKPESGIHFKLLGWTVGNGQLQKPLKNDTL